MKVYVVLYYVNYEGYCTDERCKVFKNEDEAKRYVNELNTEFAMRWGYEVEKLNDYYDYEEMDLV